MSNYNYGAMLLTTLAGRHGDTATVTDTARGRGTEGGTGRGESGVRTKAATELGAGAAIKLPTHTARQRTLVK